MSTDTTTRRKVPGRARPLTAAKAASARWSPDARTREAVRVLVAQLAPLDEQQKDQLRTLLAPAEGGA